MKAPRTLEAVFARKLLRRNRDPDWLQEIVAGEYGQRPEVPTPDEVLKAILDHFVNWSELRSLEPEDTFSVLAAAAVAVIDRRKVDEHLVEGLLPLMPAVMRRVRKNWAESFPSEGA